MRSYALHACVLLAVAAAPSTSRAEPMYTATHLGVANAYGINNAGQVVGVCSDFWGSSMMFRTAPNQPINPATDGLGIPGQAFAINSSGQVVGVANVVSGGAFRTGPNQPLNPATDALFLGVNRNGRAYAINDAGQAVGGAGRAFRTGPNAAFDPATDDLGTLGGDSSDAYGINALGQVVGSSGLGPYGVGHAYRTAPNAKINPATDDLGTLGGVSSGARAINAAGQVVGSSRIEGGGEYTLHAFRTAPNQPIDPATDDLGTLGGNTSAAYAINSAGWVVGYAQRADGGTSAFVYDGTKMYDLNDLLVDRDPGLPKILHMASGINDRGQIIAQGRYPDYPYPPFEHAFLLTPVPEPGTLALLASAAAGFLAFAHHRRRKARDRQPRWGAVS